MSTFLAHPAVFSAYAAAAVDDPDLRRGTHLRLFPSTHIGFPLAPFALWEMPALLIRVLPFTWFDRRGQPLAQLDLDLADGEATGWLTAPLPGGARLIGVEARFQEDVGEIAILDRIEDRLIAARSEAPHRVGAPMVQRLRLRGRGAVTLHGWAVTPDAIFERIVGGPPFSTLSLPIDGSGPWYADGEGRDRAWERVGSGAPGRWTRPDRPDGPFDPLDRAAEEARVTAFRAELDQHVVRLVQDPTTPPASVVEVHESPASLIGGVRRPWQRATLEVRDALLLRALDPGAGRYLGLMTRLRHLPEEPDPDGVPRATAWLAAGAFACRVRDRGRLPPPDALELRLLERLVELFPELSRVLELARQGHREGLWVEVRDGKREVYELELRAFVAAALPAPPPDLLPPPDVRLGTAQWLRAAQGPSTRFRQQFLVQSPPLAALAALGRLEAGVWTTRHEMITLTPGADPPARAATRFLGRRESLTEGRAGLVDDGAVPAGAPWGYRLALSDVFGRFGAPAELPVPLPARPAIPEPALQTDLQLAPPAAHSNPAPAGTAVFRVPVPAVEDLTAGSLPLARASVTFAGVTQEQATPQAGGSLRFEFDLPQLAVMETRRLAATAHFEDVEGTSGADTTVAVDIADPRAPVIPKTGIGILWTSRPGPSEEVEFRLAFRGQAGARYRAYLSDARGLEIPLVDAAGRRRTRAEIAVDGANRGLAGVGMRGRFRLITEPPLEPRPDGTVLLDDHLPRTLETVQFLRFVPLSARGVEAAFEDCPLVPVAVPSDRRPPAPRVEALVHPITGNARVRIVAEGCDREALEAAEPGLFGELPLEAASPPGFRLRRASGWVPDAIYARETARGTLALEDDAFTAEVDDAPTPEGLLPFVQYFYWAEVQMPPERRIPVGVTEIPLPAGAILPTEVRQREDAPGAFSLPSPPAPVMRVPPDPPVLAPEAIEATVRAGAGGLTHVIEMNIEGGPVAHPKAIRPYRVRLHLQEAGGDLQSIGAEQELVGGRLTWSTERPGAAIAGVRLRVVPIDPIGREGAPVTVDAVPV